MKISSQRHALAALRRGKNPLPTELEAESVPEQVWTLRIHFVKIFTKLHVITSREADFMVTSVKTSRLLNVYVSYCILNPDSCVVRSIAQTSY